MNIKKAFSLVELSVVILVIGILVIGITKGSRIMTESKLKTAKSLTISSPVASMSGLTLWLDTTEIANIATGTVAANNYGVAADNSDVVTWKDRNPQQIGNSLKLMSAVLDGNRPKYIKNGIGGLPTIQFDGSSDYLRNASSAIPAGSSNYTMIAVWKADTTGQQILFAQNGNCWGENAGIYMESGAMGSWGCGLGNDYFPMSYKVNVPYINIVRVNKTQTNKVTIYLNSATQAGSPSSTTTLISGPIAIGGNADGSAFFDGQVSELIIFSRAITNGEVNVIKDYLSKKYSIKI